MTAYACCQNKTQPLPPMDRNMDRNRAKMNHCDDNNSHIHEITPPEQKVFFFRFSTIIVLDALSS